MVKQFMIDNLGEFKVEKTNIFTKYKYYINDIEAQQIGKNTYSVTIDGKEIRIYFDGNAFKGHYVSIDGHIFQILKGLPWYCIALSVIALAIPLVFGNIRYFSEHGFYILGGALGGAIGGVIMSLSIALSFYIEKWWARLLISLGSVILSFGICYGIGNLLVLLMNQLSDIAQSQSQ